MAFRHTIRARSLPVYLATIFTAVVGLSISIEHSKWWGILFGPIVLVAVLLVLSNRKWSVVVADGHVCWNPLLGKQRQVSIANLVAIELLRDSEDPTFVSLSLRLKNGKQQQLQIPTDRQSAFIKCVVETNPQVEVRWIKQPIVRLFEAITGRSKKV